MSNVVEMKKVEEKYEVAKLGLTPEKVQEMVKKYGELAVTAGDSKSYRAVRQALTTMVTARTSVDKRRKELGADLRLQLNNLNGAAKKLVDAMAPTEDHLRQELKKEDDRKAADKAEKERLEKERVDKIRGMITSITDCALNAHLKTPEQISSAIINLYEINPSEDVFQEFLQEATDCLQKTKDSLSEALEYAKKREKEEAEAKEEAEERKRVDRIKTRIDAIRFMSANLSGCDTSYIHGRMQDLKKMEIDEEVYQEFLGDAKTALKDTIATVSQFLDARQWSERQAEKEKEEKRIRTIQSYIQNIRGLVYCITSFDKDMAEATLGKLEEIKIDEDFYQEFTGEAEQVLSESTNLAARTLKELEESEERASRAKLKEEIEEAHTAAIEENKAFDRQKKEAEEIEKARLDALKPDKEKILSFAVDLDTVIMSCPNIGDEKLRALFSERVNNINKLVDAIREDVR
jgi:hypothetical protein